MSFTNGFLTLGRVSNDLSGSQRGLILGGVTQIQATLTYTEITSNITQNQTATVSGASLGDYVIVACTTALAAGLEITAFVSAANTVTVRIGNASAGAITPGALLFNILVLKP